MRAHLPTTFVFALATTVACSSSRPTARASSEEAGEGFTVPIEYYKLDNGLKVVLSRDTLAPKVVTAVNYNIGFRIEPRNRTGFAHLFEHLMFQGSQNLGKMEFMKLVQSNGGVLNGSTRFDFTNYFEIAPSNTLQTILWAEADRMRGLVITQESLVNQQNVVKNEVRVNVLNRPYGGFPWLDMPQYANVNWYNAHNFYGEMRDLDAVTLEDAREFFKSYYAPNNAVLVVTGDFDPAPARGWIQQYFASIPARPRPPAPDTSEPPQEKEKRATKVDPLAPRPALAFAYHAPARNTPEYYALAVLDQLLVQGKDSRLYQALVQTRGITGEVHGAINELGHQFNISGPVLWTIWLFHDNERSPEEILKVVDGEMERVRASPVEMAELQRALAKSRSVLYDRLTGTFGFERADLLASFALFDDDPWRVNRLEQELRKVTPKLLQQTAQRYLRVENRTVLVLETKPPAPPGAKPDDTHPKPAPKTRPQPKTSSKRQG